MRYSYTRNTESEFFFYKESKSNKKKKENLAVGGQQLCQTVLKSMHYCTSYGPDKSGPTH